MVRNTTPFLPTNLVNPAKLLVDTKFFSKVSFNSGPVSRTSGLRKWSLRTMTDDATCGRLDLLASVCVVNSEVEGV